MTIPDPDVHKITLKPSQGTVRIAAVQYLLRSIDSWEASSVIAAFPCDYAAAKALLPPGDEQPAIPPAAPAAPVASAPVNVPVIVKKPSRSWTLPGTLAGLFCMMFVAVE